MTRISASAPGKIVLCGEYAVLQDAPAVCMAVNRRARVTASGSDDDCHTLMAPGYRPGRWRFRASAEGIRWLDAPPAAHSFALFERLWETTAPVPARYWSLSLDTRAFVDAERQRKLGLGASAAIAVALAAVLARMSGDESASAARAAAAHREYQGGHGSGIDVATCRHGGLIEYRRLSEPQAEPLRWPAGLHCRFLWSGRSASTADKLRALGEVRRRRGEAASAGLLQRQARVVADDWRSDDGSALLESLQHYTEALRRFDLDHGLGIFAAGHAELADVAPSMGVVYKPCGAGGGDVGAVFAPADRAAAGFAAYAGTRGFTELDLSPDPDGVTCEG